MRVLIACEESQVVCKAFREKGHEAFSCDLKPCSGGHPEWHIQHSVFDVLDQDWDLLIGHPPCDYLAYSGIAHWNAPGRLQKRLDALIFFSRLWESGIPRICLENPKGCASPTIAKYSQEIQPYYFGDPHIKTTWLWLKGLNPLVWNKQDDLFSERTSADRPEPIYTDQKGKKRYYTDAIKGGGKGKELRSKTFPGIAKAMAEQWG